MAQRRSDDHLALRSMSGSPSPGTTICSPNISSPSSSSSSSSSASSVSILQKKTEARSVNSAKNMVASSNLETSASGLKKRDSNHFLKSSALYPDDYEDMLDKDENHSREASREREREKEKTEREKELREREIKEREREREREKEREKSKKGGKKERENEEPIKETENRPVTELSDKIDPQDRQSKEKGIEMGFDSIPLTSFQDDGRPMSESQQELGKLGQDSTPNQGEEEKTGKQNQAEAKINKDEEEQRQQTNELEDQEKDNNNHQEEAEDEEEEEESEDNHQEQEEEQNDDDEEETEAMMMGGYIGDNMDDVDEDLLLAIELSKQTEEQERVDRERNAAKQKEPDRNEEVEERNRAGTTSHSTPIYNPPPVFGQSTSSSSSSSSSSSASAPTLPEASHLPTEFAWDDGQAWADLSDHGQTWVDLSDHDMPPFPLFDQSDSVEANQHGDESEASEGTGSEEDLFTEDEDTESEEYDAIDHPAGSWDPASSSSGNNNNPSQKKQALLQKVNPDKKGKLLEEDKVDEVKLNDLSKAERKPGDNEEPQPLSPSQLKALFIQQLVLSSFEEI